MLRKISNFIFFRVTRAKKATKKFLECLESETASLVFFLNKDYGRNIDDFSGRYLFRDRANKITVAAIFKKNKMKVRKKMIGNTNVTIVFKNQRALMNFLLSPKPDILNSILNQDVSYDGNLNYLSKFAYMAKRLQLMTAGEV
jgi:hypothetical protein